MINVVNVKIRLSDNASLIYYTDDKFYSVLAEDYKSLPFTCVKGTELDDEQTLYISHLSKKHKIYNSALGKVASSDVTRKMLIRKLYEAYKDKNIDKDELRQLCSEVADIFVQKGYIDDYKYAERFALNLKEYKRYGRKRISKQLYMKGVDRDTINEIISLPALAESSGDVLYHFNKKYTPEDLKDKKTAQKIAAMLFRLGFSSDDIRVIYTLEPDTDSETDMQK